MQDYSNDTLYHVTQKRNSETYCILYKGGKNQSRNEELFLISIDSHTVPMYNELRRK